MNSREGWRWFDGWLEWKGADNETSREREKKTEEVSRWVRKGGGALEGESRGGWRERKRREGGWLTLTGCSAEAGDTIISSSSSSPSSWIADSTESFEPKEDRCHNNSGRWRDWEGQRGIFNEKASWMTGTDRHLINWDWALGSFPEFHSSRLSGVLDDRSRPAWSLEEWSSFWKILMMGWQKPLLDSDDDVVSWSSKQWLLKRWEHTTSPKISLWSMWCRVLVKRGGGCVVVVVGWWMTTVAMCVDPRNETWWYI